MNAKVKKVGLIVVAGIGGILLLKGGSKSDDGWSGGGSGGGSEESEEKPEVYKKGRDDGAKQERSSIPFVANVIPDIDTKKVRTSRQISSSTDEGGRGKGQWWKNPGRQLAKKMPVEKSESSNWYQNPGRKLWEQNQ